MRRTPTTTTRSRNRARTTLLLALAAAACGPKPAPTPDPAAAARDIEAMLLDSAESWTRGDLDSFLDDYATDATFVGSAGVTRGRAQIRQNYIDGYWSTGMPEHGLRFRLLEVRTVGANTAVAVGRYILFDRGTGEAAATGLFSLTLRRTPDGWQITHDHSSADGTG